MRIRNALLNGVTGLVSQFFIIILGFVQRAIFINILGEELLGYNSTFTNILSILSVTELGLGAAITFCLYKPLHDQDLNKVAGIMNLFKKFYAVIGIVVFSLALITSPFIQIFLNGYTQPLAYIRTIFLLYAFNSVITYFLGYPRTFLFAAQKNYYVTLTDFFAKVILLVGQIAVLVLTGNYLLFLFLVTITNTLSNVILRQIYAKNYPEIINNKSKIDDESKRKIISVLKYLSISTVISVGVFGTDNIIISSFVGVTVAGFYGNYAMIVTQIQTMFIALVNGAVAGLGDVVAEGDLEKIRKIFKVYDFTYYLIASFVGLSFYVLFNPFIGDIWIKQSQFVLDMKIVSVIVFNAFMYYRRQPIWQFQNVAGLFKECLPFSIVELFLNLFLSIFLVIKMGLIGVFIATSVAYLVSWVGQALMIHRYCLKIEVKGYFFKQIYYFLIWIFEIVIVMLLGQFFNSNSYLHFGYLLILCAIVPNLINILIFGKSEEFSYLKQNIINRLLKRKV